MTRFALASVALLALMPTLLPTLLPQAAQAASFTVIDRRASAEVSEVTRLYIDGRLAARFQLHQGVDRQEAQVTAPDRPSQEGRPQYDYALCGEITVLKPGGGTEIHEVNGSGVLVAPDGHVLEAIGAADFTAFYLIDLGRGDTVKVRQGHTLACQPPGV